MKRVIWIVAFMSCSHSYANKGNLASFEVLRDRYTNIIQYIIAEYGKKNSNVPECISTACQYIEAMEKRDERIALPFLEEVAFSTNTIPHIRGTAARAYLKIADLDESVDLMRHLYEEGPIKNSWRYFLNKKLIERIKLEQADIDMETQRKIRLLMLEIALHIDNSGDANDADQYLCHDLTLYSNSVQRATLARFATGGSPWCTNTFNPIKAHFDALPKSELVDLREQFPELPPLPNEEGGGVRWVYGMSGIALILVCTALALKCVKRGRK